MLLFIREYNKRRKTFEKARRPHKHFRTMYCSHKLTHTLASRNPLKYDALPIFSIILGGLYPNIVRLDHRILAFAYCFFDFTANLPNFYTILNYIQLTSETFARNLFVYRTTAIKSNGTVATVQKSISAFSTTW